MAYIPWFKHKHSKERVAVIFGKDSNADLANETKRNNPALYAELKEEAIHYRLIDRPTGTRVQLLSDRAYSDSEMEQILKTRQRQQNTQQRNFTPEETEAREAFSRERCVEIFCKSGQANDENNAAKLMRQSPEIYRMAKVAARTYGVL